MPTGVYNADGTVRSVGDGAYQVAPAEKVFIHGDYNSTPHKVKTGETIKPGAVAVMDAATGTALEAAVGAAGPFLGVAMERDLYQDVDGLDGGSVLDAYKADEECNINGGQHFYFACLADGAITAGAKVEVGAVSGSVRALVAGGVAGVYMGKEDAADTDRIVIRYTGGVA